MKRTVLKNGINVFANYLPDSQSVFFTILVKTGSRYEEENVSGVSHFLEHMFFKGSQNYPDSTSISTIVDSIGGDFNAATSKETTEYYIKAEKKHFELIFDVLTDMIMHPLFVEEEIEKEKGVVVEEINLYQDNPGAQVESNLEKTMWPKSPLGREILGTKESVKSLTRQQIFDYKERYYVSENIILGISGNFDQKILNKKIEETWSRVERKSSSRFKTVKEKQTRPSLDIEYKKTQQAHLALGFKSFGHNHKDNVATFLLGSILGGSMSSRLFITIREQKGLAYYVSASNSTYYQVGNFTIHSGLKIERTKETLSEILYELRKIKSDLVSETELNRAKDYVRGKIALAMEDKHKELDWILERFAFSGKVKHLKEFYEKLDKVKAEDLKRVANEIFKNENMNLALIGPFKNRKEFEKELRIRENF